MRKVLMFFIKKDYHRIDVLSFSVSCFLAGLGYWWTASAVIWGSFLLNWIADLWLERELERQLEEIITEI